MYYKIENKDSRVYKELRAMREKELQLEEENKKSIAEKIPYDWDEYLGHSGQQNFKRVTSYIGFCFKEPEKVDLKVWKRDKQHPDTFVPNMRTKAGRDLEMFLRNGLKGGRYTIPLEILGLVHLGRFVFPYIEIIGNVIILFLDDKHEPDDENVIEITKREFTSLLHSK